jgi:tetratricopeptide (TPR) repeat protein
VFFILCFPVFADIYSDLSKDFKAEEITMALDRIERFSNITPGKQADELVAFGKRLKEIDDVFRLFQYEKSADLYQILLNEYPADHPLRTLLLQKQNYFETFQVYKELSQGENREPLEQVVALTRRLTELHPQRTVFVQKNKLVEEALAAWNLGHGAFQKKQWKEALPYFEKAAGFMPQHETLKLYLEQTRQLVKVADYFQNAQYRFATPLLKRAVFLLSEEKSIAEWLEQSQLLEKWNLEGELAYADGKYSESIDAFSRINKLNPQDQVAKVRLSTIEKILNFKKEGTRFLIDGKYSLALSQFNQAIEINATDIDLKQRIAVCYYLVDYQKKQIPDFSPVELQKLATYPLIKQKVLDYKAKEDKQNIEKELVSTNLKNRQEGYELFRKKDYVQALEKFNLAVQANPQDYTSKRWIRLCQSAQELKKQTLEMISKKDRANAMVYYEQLIQVNPEENDLLDQIK